MSAVPPLNLIAFSNQDFSGAVDSGDQDFSGAVTGSTSTAIGRRSNAPRRVIDPDGSPLYAEVTVQEDHDDTLVITEHPVEYGAAITDHAYKRPAEVRLRVGWSDAYVGGTAYAARAIYAQIQALQQSRRPFRVVTGKRDYDNMLVAELRTESNSGLEYTFLADITLREIILVSTQTIQGMPSDEANLANVKANAPTNTDGQRSVLPTSVTKAQTDGWGITHTAGLAGSPSGPSVTPPSR